MLDLTKKPFNLSPEDIAWVDSTLAGLSFEEKIGQLFCVLGMSPDPAMLKSLVTEAKIGGIMFRPGPAEMVSNSHKILQESSKIPLLTAANLESGGNGVASEGTNYGKPMQAAAVKDHKTSGYRLGKIACAEGAAVGCNWAFAPIVDVDLNFRNPITNLRTFGSDVDRIIDMGKGYMQAAAEENVAVSIKHFPGDGVDERDHHLVMSVNSQSIEEWDRTSGRIYQELIDAGAQTMMVGHIALPAYTRKFVPGIKDEDILPASLSKEILNNLVRGQLGFNGLIVTDATLMIGFMSSMPRALAVPTAIANGCDMFLFNKNLAEDIGYMIKGYHSGILTEQRLNEAVTRILALKASLKLHKKQQDGTLVPSPEAHAIIGCAQHKTWAKECADNSVTLVKNKENLLPLSPEKTKRVYVNVLENDTNMDSPLKNAVKNKLEKEGFDVTFRKKDIDYKNVLGKLAKGGELPPEAMGAMQELMQDVEGFKSTYDLVLYVSNFETASNNTVIRISWEPTMGMGNDFPWFVKEVPTAFVSFANPYHLLDVPMMKTFVNAYTFTEEVVDNTFEKLFGRSEFKGISPVDPFCGREDTSW